MNPDRVKPKSGLDNLGLTLIKYITSKKGFQIFFIISILFGLGVFADSLFPSLIEPELQNCFISADINSKEMLKIAGSILTALWSMSLCGILMFRRWGRALYVGLTILANLIMPFLNTQKLSPNNSFLFSQY